VRLYRGTTAEFIADATHNRIAELLQQRFVDEFRYRPGSGEVASWRNSLRAMSAALSLGDLDRQGILVELQLPLTSRRLDVMVTGRDDGGRNNAVIVELKQWDSAGRSDIPDCVTVPYYGRDKDVLHPSRQAERYEAYLRDTHPAFSSGDVGVRSCSFLHNFPGSKDASLFGSEFKELLLNHPAFVGDQIDGLTDFLIAGVGSGDDGTVLERVAKGGFVPHKRLLDHVSKVIRNEPAFVPLDEQVVAFNAVMAAVTRATKYQGDAVFLIRGGPGTGKSLIAVNLIAALSERGIRSIHATGSKAFTQNLRRAVGSRAAALFSYYRNLASKSDRLDVVVLDEAHRIRETSTNRFTPAVDRSGKRQIDEILDAARVAVFFIDDLQVVRPGEVGSSDLIREAAAVRGAPMREFELEAQFRANGSDAFIQWVDNTLELRRTPQVLWPTDDPFDVQIMDTPAELEAAIRARADAGSTARLVAGFCWPWSLPRPDGTLEDDVVVGDWRRPWNAKGDTARLAAGIPKSDYWASDPRGIDQVGCVYTAQGFEFDYVGVIFGEDLVYRPGRGWVGQPQFSKDSFVRRSGTDLASFTDYVRHTYRVLLTRGLRGCYITFLDERTRDFVLSRLEERWTYLDSTSRVSKRAAETGDGPG
jgi:DUF2075 family protein